MQRFGLVKLKVNQDTETKKKARLGHKAQFSEQL